MSFLESQAKAGYYPTPPELLPSIAALVTPGEGRLLDPCCGKGEAAAFLAKAWGLKAYGIEIHHGRALEASVVLEQVIEDDYAAVTASHNFSVLFLNPPYDYSETAGRRLEYEFLRDTTKYLTPGGILIYIIPGYRILAHERIAVYLSTHYQDLRIYRFPADHYDAFRQVVIFGRKKPNPWRDDKVATGIINSIANDAVATPTLPSADQVQPAERYTLPAPPTSRFIFHSTQLDWEAAAREALESGVWADREWKELNLTVEPTLAEDTLIHGGFHARVDAFAQDLGGIVLLSLIGRETHVKALWAALMTGKILHFRPGLEFRKGEARMYRTFKARLPTCGAAHWVILHKRATVEGTEAITTSVQGTLTEEEETPSAFYTFQGDGDSNFLAQLGQAMLLPTLPGWEEHLVREGRRRRKISQIPAHSTHGCQVWRVLPSTPVWRDIISYGIEDGLLNTSSETIERAQSKSALVPAMPLKRGHIARLLEAGLLNNVVISNGQQRLILRGRTVQIQEEIPTSEENVTITKTRYLTEILAVDLDTGEMRHITEEKTLASFIEEWQEQLAQAIIAHFTPRYRFDYPDRLSKLQMELINDVLAKRCHLPGRQTTGLLEGQKHVATAAYEVLKHNRFAIIVGEMGAGKTKIGIAAAGLRELDQGAFPVLTLCPPHLVEKWAREWRETWPKCLPVILKSPKDVDDFAHMVASSNGYHYVGIMSSTMASLGSGWEPAVIRHWRNRNTFACPDCGRVQLDEESAPVIDIGYFTEKQRTCLWCHASLWQFANQARKACAEYSRRGEEQLGFTSLSQAQRLVRAGEWSFFYHAKPTPSRWPLADYIIRRHPRLFKMLVVDEAHQYKGESADRAYAFGELANTIPSTIMLTGTIFGGMAPSLFYLLYRIDGRFRRMFEYDDVQGFTERYGVLEREVKYYEEVDDGHSMAGNRRRRTTVRPRPGISPEMVTLLLDTTIFVRVSDLGVRLPPLTEIPVVLDMEERHREHYDRFYAQAIEALREAKEYGVDLAGSFLQNLLGYSTAPFRIHEIISRDEETGEIEVWASAPDLEVVCTHCGRPLEALNEYCLDCHPGLARDTPEEDEEGKVRETIYSYEDEEDTIHPAGCGAKRTRIFPKEQWLIDLAKAERAQGRKVIVFCRQTATRDITERLARLLEAEGLRTLRLGSVSAARREHWLNQKVRQGLDVFLVNPRSVETGLDLVAFATGVFYEVDYSLYTMWQAARRLWRLGQTQDVTIYYPVYEGTLMEKAAALVKQKMAAALMLYGDNVESVMGQANEGSFLQELTRSAVEGAEIEDLASIFARHNNEQISSPGYLLAGEEPDLADTIMECSSAPEKPREHRASVQAIEATQLALAL